MMNGSMFLCLRLFLSLLLPLYVASTPPPKLLFTSSEHVYRMSALPFCTNLHKVLAFTGTEGRDVDYDFGQHRFYWGHTLAGSAGVASFNGQVITTYTTIRTELAVDWQDNRVFFSDPSNLAFHDLNTNAITPINIQGLNTFYDLSFFPRRDKLFWVDGLSNLLFQYTVNTAVLTQSPIACTARHISHIDGDKIFYSCPLDGIYYFDLNTSTSTYVYDDADTRPFDDVTSYNGVAYWAREGCVYSLPLGGGTNPTQLCCLGVDIEGITVVHPSLQP